MFLAAATEYERSLVYSTELNVDDLKQCFPRSDEECIRLQRDSDRLYRELLINEVLGALQSVDDELRYLSGCERGMPVEGTSCTSGPATPPDVDEVVKCLSAAGSSFDKYFDVVPAADVRAAVETVAKTSPRWDLTLLGEGDGGASSGGADGGSAAAAAGARRSISPSMRLASGTNNEREAHPPTTVALARFALPTLAAWLVSPLMSLVDTAVVGRESATLLAALGPATMIGDSMSYLCSFLGVATTNLVATEFAAPQEGTADADGTAEQKGGGGSRRDALAQIFGSGARLAALCGVVSALLQLSFGRAVLCLYTDARSAALVAPAFEYVRIRALGAPAALLARVGTAACLALKDPLTPLLAVAASGLLNLALDVLLVSVLGFGIGGAAWATLVSEAACAAIVLRAVRLKLALAAVPQQETMQASKLPARLRSLLPPRAAVAA